MRTVQASWRTLLRWLDAAEQAEPPRAAQSLGRRIFPALLFPPRARFDVELRRLLLTTANLVLLATWASAALTQGSAALNGHYAAAGVGLLVTAALPWQRLRHELFALFGLAGVFWVQTFLSANGEPAGPSSFLYFFVILLSAPVMPTRAAALVGVAAAVAYSLPALERALYASALSPETIQPASDWFIRGPLFIVLSVLLASFGRKAGRERASLIAPPRAPAPAGGSAARDEYISVLSHELRNPLVGIAAAAEVLSRELPPGSSGSARAGSIGTEAGHMLALLEEVMDATRVELGSLGSILVPTDLAAVVRTTVATLNTPDHAIVTRGTDGKVQVMADERRIRQVVLNLVSNAAAYSPRGTQIEVSVGRSTDGRSAIVEVRDHGPGIPSRDRERLYRKFARLSTAEGTRGSGLGLYICRGIVTDHGGRLWADWPSDGGSAFSFSLPIARKPIVPAGPAQAVAG